MNTDEGTARAAADSDSESGERVEPQDQEAEGPAPSWWHRSHPTFSALVGFYTGVATMILVPGAFAAILNALFDSETAESMFPFILTVFAVPLALLGPRKTRHFAQYLLFGMFSTAVVVGGVGALVLWILFQRDS